MKPIFEKVRNDESSIISFIYDEDTFRTPWHFHPEMELTLILEGSGMRYVGNHVAAFQAGDLVLLGSGLPHCWRMSEQVDLRARSHVIQWNGSLFPNIPELNDIRTLCKKAQRGIKFGMYISSKNKALFHKLQTENTAVLHYTNFIELLQNLSETTSYEYLAGESYRIDTSDNISMRFDRIHQHLKEHYHESIKLKEMGELIGMTGESFSRFFSKSMQKPFFTFLNEYRVNRASRMLIETDLQVAEIAFASGYESLPFFYKQFKKHKGHSPLSFRKLYTT